MILSVSRRTDIPAFYLEWFFNRLKEGYVLVRNPMNYHQVSRVRLSPDIIDCIVFWTKNPSKILKHLDKLKAYNYYFQISINPYDNTLEKNIPSKKHIIDSFIELSEKIGKERVIWRYAPIILTKDIDIAYHEKYFEYMASKLSPYTERCIFGYLDLYKKTKRNMKSIELRKLDEKRKILLAKKLLKISDKYKIDLECCYGDLDLSQIGIKKSQCINTDLISEILGQKIEVKKDKGQTDKCTCIQSIDIGAYNSCRNGCIYCYANYSDNTVVKNTRKHDVNSPFLIGNIEKDDKISDRKMESYIKDIQLKLHIK